jgi:hypothetical protein
LFSCSHQHTYIHQLLAHPAMSKYAQSAGTLIAQAAKDSVRKYCTSTGTFLVASKLVSCGLYAAARRARAQARTLSHSRERGDVP